jgi:hypothetical protein
VLLKKNENIFDNLSTTKKNIVTELQVVKFINYVYLPDVQPNRLAYQEMDISMNMVFNTVNMYTNIMINKSVQSFSTWCKKKDILLFDAPMIRKRQKTSETISSIRS